MPKKKWLICRNGLPLGESVWFYWKSIRLRDALCRDTNRQTTVLWRSYVVESYNVRLYLSACRESPLYRTLYHLIRYCPRLEVGRTYHKQVDYHARFQLLVEITMGCLTHPQWHGFSLFFRHDLHRCVGQLRYRWRFFCPRTMLVSANACWIDAYVFKIRFDLKRLKNQNECPVIAPFTKASICRFPKAIAFWQITPRCATTRNPQLVYGGKNPSICSHCSSDNS